MCQKRRRATFEVRGKHCVSVLDKEDVVHRREIVVRNELGDIFVIDRGVGVDDRIIVDGTQQVHDGATVKYEYRPPAQIPGHQNSRPE